MITSASTVDDPQIPPHDTAWRRYQQWIHRHTATADDLFRQRMAVTRLRERPLISVVVPVHETPPEILRQMLASIERQTYPHWQLCLVDDGSSDAWIARHLERLARRDARVRFRRRPTNGGISAATNDAIALATGDLVAFVDHDDLFDPRMLYEVVRRFLNKPDTDIVHFDLDHLRSGGRRTAPVFTPSWSPDLLLSVTYIVHPVVRRPLLDRVGPLRPEYDGAQDYDLILRLAEATDRIERIPEVFYHWRVWPRSASDGGKPYARAARKRVLDAAIARRGLRATCEDRPQADWFRVRFAIEGDPLVSVIVPLASQDGDAPGRAPDRLIASLRRMLAMTAYRHVELVLVGPAGGVDSLSDAGQLDGEGIPVRTVHCESADEGVAVTHGARESRGAYLLVLSPDLEPRETDWLSSLLEYAQQSPIGVVGGQVFHPNGSVWHAGIVLPQGRPIPVRQDFLLNPGPHPVIHVANLSAVSGGCLLTRRSVFDAVGGYRPTATVGFSDVDYCLRARAQAHRVVMTPYACLQRRNPPPIMFPASGLDAFRAQWPSFVDPYPSPNHAPDGTFLASEA